MSWDNLRSIPGKFQMQCNVINQSHQAVHEVSRVYVPHISKSLYPLANMSSPLPPLLPGYHHCTFCFYGYNISPPPPTYKGEQTVFSFLNIVQRSGSFVML